VRPRPGGGTEYAEGAAKTKPQWQTSRFSRLQSLTRECLASRLAWDQIGCRMAPRTVNHTVQIREALDLNCLFEKYLPPGLAVLGLEQFQSFVQRLIAFVLLRRVVVNIVVLGLTDKHIRRNRFILNLLTVRSFVLRYREQ